MHVRCQISETRAICRACSVALYISMKLSCITFQIVQHLIETVLAILIYMYFITDYYHWLWAAQTFVIVLLCQSSTINIHCLDESSLQVHHTAAVMQTLVCVTLPPKSVQIHMHNYNNILISFLLLRSWLNLAHCKSVCIVLRVKKAFIVKKNFAKNNK